MLDVAAIRRYFELQHAFVLAALLLLEAAPVLLNGEGAAAVALLDLRFLLLEQLLHDRVFWLGNFALFPFYDVVHTF